MEHLDFVPKLVAFDLDGTLTESKQNLDPEMGALLGRLMENVPIAVMSGAIFEQFQKQFLWGLPNTVPNGRLYIFPTNAARCFLWKDGEWQILYDHSLTEEEKKKVIVAIHQALEETDFQQPDQLWGPQIEDRSSQITFSALGQLAPPEIKKQWDPTREKRQPIWEKLLALLPSYEVRLNATTSIDITQKGITKAYGIRRLSEITKMTIADMIYVGDALWNGGNDSIVKETGIRTIQVSGPKETEEFIRSLLAKS